MNEGNSMEVAQIKRERLKIKHERWKLRKKHKQIWRLCMFGGAVGFAASGSIITDPSAANGAFIASGLFGVAVALTVR